MKDGRSWTAGWLYVTTFVTGAAVMALEMAASRFLAPYFGTSLPVWANLIGLILIALSAGYYAGGRLADRLPDGRVLANVVVAGGIFASLVPLAGQGIFRFMASGITDTPVPQVVASFVAILLVFFPPVFLLAFVSPFAIRLATLDIAKSGQVAGNLYAFSTLGSITGTFVPAFVTIPFIGTRETILIASVLLIAAGALGPGRRARLLWLFLPLAVYLAGPPVVKPVPGLLYERETPYQFVQVVTQGSYRYLIVNEGGGIQSVYNAGGILTGMYYDYYLPLPLLRTGQDKKVLVLGSAGGTILRQYYTVLANRYHLDLTGVEIDPVVAALGPLYFGLDPDQVHVVVADARPWLAASRASYDIIIVDAYSHQMYIPFQLTTREFFASVKQHLRPGGLVALNVNAVSPDSSLLLAIERTVAAVFPYTYQVPVPGSYNYVVIGTDLPVDAAALRALDGSSVANVARTFAAGLVPVGRTQGLVLTDNRAPVEFLTDQMIWQVLPGGRP